MSLQANISNTPFDQKFQGHREVGDFNCHRQKGEQTNKKTDGHCNSMTESAQWGNSVREKKKEKRDNHFSPPPQKNQNVKVLED